MKNYDLKPTQENIIGTLKMMQLDDESILYAF